MPIAQIHCVRGAFPDDAISTMLTDLSVFYARALYPEAENPPVERVRIFVSLAEPGHWAAGGRIVGAGDMMAPYFTCLVLTGRTVEQHHSLIAGFSEIISRALGCDMAAIRGQIIPVEPDNWGIGGRPASVVRAAEIAARGGS